MHPILTLEARGNVMLESMRDYFKLSTGHVRNEIQKMHADLIEVLASKSVSYADLRGALVPATDKHELALIFDSQEIESSWYGEEVIGKVLRILDERVSCSVLCGDLIHKDQEFIYELLRTHLVAAREFEFVPSTLLYCVYLNNLTEKMADALHSGLAQYRPYVGCIPVTYSSLEKTYLSPILVRAFVKHRKKIIMPHEDDRPNKENVNMLGYPFEDIGYQYVSLHGSLYGVFLSYKIERPVFPGFESDIEFSLNSVSETIVPLADLRVQVEEAKLEYLKGNKAGSFSRAGLAEVSSEQLRSLIESKIADNYIYNMEHLPEHSVTKFNVMIEVGSVPDEPQTRLMASLEYSPEKGVLRVITMY